MANIDLYPLQDNYESKLSQPYDGTSSVIYVDSIPTATLPVGYKILVTINPGTSFAQVVEVNGWSSGQLNVSSTTVEKANGANYTTRTHGAKSPIIISDNFAYWKEIATVVNTKADTDNPTFTRMITGPVYASLSALTTAYPTPTNGMQSAYCILEGQYYDAQGGSRQPRASGVNENASTTVAGKVELSTLAERQAGTATGGTGATLVLTNDALTTTSAGAGSAGLIPLLNTSGKLDNSFLSVSSDAIVKTFTAGEGMSTGQIFRQGRSVSYPGDSISQLTADTSDLRGHIGYDTTNTKAGQSYTSAGGILTQIQAQLKKVGTPTGNLTCVVRDSASGAGNIVATSTNTIAESTLSTASLGTMQTFTFNTELPNSVYYIEIQVDRANSITNYSNWVFTTTNPYAGGVLYTINSGGTWSSIAIDHTFTVTATAVTEVNTKVYKANAKSTTFNKVLGAVQATVVTDATFNGVIGGVVAGYTGQTAGEVYYLKDDGSTGTTAGTVSTKVGRAISATEINFVPPL